ncbi:DNA helicase PIF1, ATP-dependent [Tanacetum coccineum]
MHLFTAVPVTYHNIGHPSHQFRNCNATMWYEEREEKSKTAVNLTFSLCCQGGKLLLPRFNNAPPPLNHLLSHNDTSTAKFRDQIRVYNSMFSFTSFGARIDHSINTGRAPYTFRINGQNYHRMGSLIPQEGMHPKFAQLYFFDTQNEVRNQTGAFIDKETSEGIDEQIVASLIQMLDQYSSVAKAFRMARDWCTTHNSINFYLRLHSEWNTTRQYNAPTVFKVAALIVNDFRDGLPTRDIIINSKDNVPKRVLELHPSYMALQYPLLFPYGEDGFHDKIPYLIQQRPNESSTLLRGGRLFQQYLVDAYTAVEEQRLNWTRNNQDTLRVELYHNLCDAVTRGDTSAVGLGKRIVLLRTFTGSPRYMMQNYQDAMALCRTYGNPDLFITFNSNPKWPEISEMLTYFPGQKSHDRPEIGTRVFKIKLTELLDDLTKKHVFGESRGVMYVIEFQKRGLPHTHILLWLKEHCKCKTPSDIDDIISVELPSPTDDPDAYKTVTDYMLHGPCGKDAKTQHVQPMGNVQNIFQNNFRQKPSLMKKATHIIEEGTIRSKAIKYLFKYLNKGPDRATIVIKENVKNGTTVAREKVLEVDEIKNYLNCRFLAPCEVVWRLFSFDIHYSYPTVMQLSFHLPNQNAITLRDSKKLPALLQKEGIDVTMFTDWFELNKRDPAARAHTYAEIPKHYVWHEKDKLWKQRKQRKCIVQGFEELMTVNNRLYATFKETCFAYGLLNDDSRPLKLWEENWQTLAEDILHKRRKLFNYPELQLTDEQIRNYCLMEIKELLHKYGRGYREDFLIQDNNIKIEIRAKDCARGIASLLLPAGRTAHSRFVIPLELMENSTCGIKQNTQLAELMQEVQLIIWDEAPMTQRYAFEALDITIRDILGFKDSERRQ